MKQTQKNTPHKKYYKAKPWNKSRQKTFEIKSLFCICSITLAIFLVFSFINSGIETVNTLVITTTIAIISVSLLAVYEIYGKSSCAQLSAVSLYTNVAIILLLKLAYKLGYLDLAVSIAILDTLVLAVIIMVINRVIIWKHNIVKNKIKKKLTYARGFFTNYVYITVLFAVVSYIRSGFTSLGDLFTKEATMYIVVFSAVSALIVNVLIFLIHNNNKKYMNKKGPRENKNEKYNANDAKSPRYTKKHGGGSGRNQKNGVQQ